MDAREFLRTDVIVLTIVIYALIGVAADAMARFLEQRSSPGIRITEQRDERARRSAALRAVRIRTGRHCQRPLRSYGSRVVIEKLNLHIDRGEFVALLGESGCGKTTLLRALAGLDPIQGGRIVAPPRPAVVFQEHRLLPWDNLWRNVAFGLQAPDSRRAAEALTEVGLGDRLEDWPRNLSGGQAQRVALARALVQQPGFCCSTSRLPHSTR